MILASSSILALRVELSQKCPPRMLWPVNENGEKYKLSFHAQRWRKIVRCNDY